MGREDHNWNQISSTDILREWGESLILDKPFLNYGNKNSNLNILYARHYNGNGKPIHPLNINKNLNAENQILAPLIEKYNPNNKTIITKEDFKYFQKIDYININDYPRLRINVEFELNYFIPQNIHLLSLGGENDSDWKMVLRLWSSGTQNYSKNKGLYLEMNNTSLTGSDGLPKEWGKSEAIYYDKGRDSQEELFCYQT